MKLKDLLSNDIGLGDTVARAAKALGIEQSESCSCKKRQRKLNKLVPYKTNATSLENRRGTK